MEIRNYTLQAACVLDQIFLGEAASMQPTIDNQPNERYVCDLIRVIAFISQERKFARVTSVSTAFGACP